MKTRHTIFFFQNSGLKNINLQSTFCKSVYMYAKLKHWAYNTTFILVRSLGQVFSIPRAYAVLSNLTLQTDRCLEKTTNASLVRII